MPYRVNFPETMPEGAKVVVPISMGQVYHTGERLRALLQSLNNYDVTVIVADSLQRHNVGIDEALRMGDKFLEKNTETLRSLNVVRWNEWILHKREEFDLAKEVINRIIDAKPKEHNIFYARMVKTAKRCFNSQALEASIEYQKEEYAVLLTWGCFDYLVYPRNLSDAMAYIYKNLTDFKMPRYIHAHLQELQACHVTDIGFLKKKQRKENSLPLVLRLALDNLENILFSQEISEHAKQIFIDRIANMLDTANQVPNKQVLELAGSSQGLGLAVKP